MPTTSIPQILEDGSVSEHDPPQSPYSWEGHDTETDADVIFHAQSNSICSWIDTPSTRKANGTTYWPNARIFINKTTTARDEEESDLQALCQCLNEREEVKTDPRLRIDLSVLASLHAPLLEYARRRQNPMQPEIDLQNELADCLKSTDFQERFRWSCRTSTDTAGDGVMDRTLGLKRGSSVKLLKWNMAARDEYCEFHTTGDLVETLKELSRVERGLKEEGTGFGLLTRFYDVTPRTKAKDKAKARDKFKASFAQLHPGTQADYLKTCGDSWYATGMDSISTSGKRRQKEVEWWDLRETYGDYKLMAPAVDSYHET